MQVEVLYFDGCPSHERLLPRLRGLLEDVGAAGTEVVLRRVEDADAAQSERFLGSPTVRVDGVDVEADAADRRDFGLKCRLYRSEHGLVGLPADHVIIAALTRGRQQTRQEPDG